MLVMFYQRLPDFKAQGFNYYDRSSQPVDI